MDYEIELNEYIEQVVRRDASDLHLSVGSKPVFRVYRNIESFIQKDIVKPIDTENIVKLLLNPEQLELLNSAKHILFSYRHRIENGQVIRFRGTAYHQSGTITVVLRRIKKLTKTLKELGLPSLLESIASRRQGLFLIVGPAGHGKSTTLATMIETVNKKLRRNILTIENPIEFIYENEESVINQREIPLDVSSFRTGIDISLRSDADIILIGEMRELDTIRSVITAAEVGHLVFSTVHANSASQTIHRIVDSFESTQQNQIRYQLAQALLGIFSIRLVTHKNGGLIPAYELLLNNHGVANLIRENRIASIDSIIQTSGEDGMISLNRSLAQLVQSGEISIETAIEYSTDAEGLRLLI